MRVEFALLLVPMLLVSLLEMASIAMVIPLIRTITDTGGGSSTIIDTVSDFIVPADLSIFWAGGIFVVIFATKNLLVLVMTYMIFWVTFRNLGDFQTRLFGHYLHAPLEHYLAANSASVVRNLITSANRVFEVIRSLLNTIMEGMMSLAAFALLVAVEPVIALVTTTLLVATGIGIYRLLGARIQEWGRQVWATEGEMIQSINQGVGAIRDIKILGCEDVLTSAFWDTVRRLAIARTFTSATEQIPRLLVEVLVVSGFLLVIAVFAWQGRPAQDIIGVAGLFGMAALRLMPSANRIMSNLNNFRQATAFIDDMYRTQFLDLPDHETDAQATNHCDIEFRNRIDLVGVSYRYPNAEGAALTDVNLTIRRGEFLGLVGPSGAGKSTLVDILLGLLRPQAGEILVDGERPGANVRAWQRHVGYVPQDIFITDDTLRCNIAFGVSEADVDDNRVRQVLADAGLMAMVSDWPDGLDTRLGERGSRLSGGQKQRVGIARALYRDPDILVLDEATSALDSDTEQAIADTIANLSGRKTIIAIAHRLSTLNRANRLALVIDGRIVAEGSFHDLRERSNVFRSMVDKGALTSATA